MTARRLGAALALAAVVACSTDAVGVDACRQIEATRCAQAPACNISLQPPYFTSGSSVEACVRFYDDACLHGLASSPPGQSAVDACTKAIQNDGCAVVAHPETDPACAWLVPTGAAADASGGAATPDAADGAPAE
ncbi:MAG TPA: hypothetical protein VE987_00995 [Polyangiaceae bacterium]|nr:hypothetical protein [Polyangiaceae bacterium]